MFISWILIKVDAIDYDSKTGVQICHAICSWNIGLLLGYGTVGTYGLLCCMGDKLVVLHLTNNITRTCPWISQPGVVKKYFSSWVEYSCFSGFRVLPACNCGIDSGEWWLLVQYYTVATRRVIFYCSSWHPNIQSRLNYQFITNILNIILKFIWTPSSSLYHNLVMLGELVKKLINESVNIGMEFYFSERSQLSED